MVGRTRVTVAFQRAKILAGDTKEGSGTVHEASLVDGLFDQVDQVVAQHPWSC